MQLETLVFINFKTYRILHVKQYHYKVLMLTHSLMQNRFKVFFANCVKLHNECLFSKFTLSLMH
jgi:hypothetical protein